MAAALRDLGFNLTRQGIRRGASDVDRLLTMSAAKSIALVEVVDCEYVARGEALRALVLTDSEQAAATADEVLLGVLRPEAGTAPEAVLTLGGDARTAPCDRSSSRVAGCAARRTTPMSFLLRCRSESTSE